MFKLSPGQSPGAEKGDLKSKGVLEREEGDAGRRSSSMLGGSGGFPARKAWLGMFYGPVTTWCQTESHCPASFPSLPSQPPLTCAASPGSRGQC